jgi:hypothetical protein
MTQPISHEPWRCPQLRYRPSVTPQIRDNDRSSLLNPEARTRIGETSSLMTVMTSIDNVLTYPDLVAGGVDERNRARRHARAYGLVQDKSIRASRSFPYVVDLPSWVTSSRKSKSPSQSADLRDAGYHRFDGRALRRCIG